MISSTSAMLLVVHMALSAAISPSRGESALIAPYSKAALQAVLVVSELQAPTGDDDVDDLVDFASELFYLQDDYMRFITGDGEQRSELRLPRDVEFDGAIKTLESLEGTLKLHPTDTSDPGEDDPEQYTFMQLHTKTGSSPLVRLANYGYREWDGGVFQDYLWSIVDGADPEHQPMIARPSGAFAVKVQLQDGALAITVGSETRTETVSWSGEGCYFKAGTYVQNGPHSDFPVDYSTLTYTGSCSTSTELAACQAAASE